MDTASTCVRRREERCANGFPTSEDLVELLIVGLLCRDDLCRVEIFRKIQEGGIREKKRERGSSILRPSSGLILVNWRDRRRSLKWAKRGRDFFTDAPEGGDTGEKNVPFPFHVPASGAAMMWTPMGGKGTNVNSVWKGRGGRRGKVSPKARRSFSLNSKSTEYSFHGGM